MWPSQQMLLLWMIFAVATRFICVIKCLYKVHGAHDTGVSCLKSNCHCQYHHSFNDCYFLSRYLAEIRTY